MSDTVTRKEKLVNEWSRVQEMFGALAHPQYLTKEARQGACQYGRGAILLHIIQGQPVVYYKTWEHFENILDPGKFKKGLKEAIAQYNIDEQIIIVVCFDDIILSQALQYKWFGICIIPSK